MINRQFVTHMTFCITVPVLVWVLYASTLARPTGWHIAADLVCGLLIALFGGAVGYVVYQYQRTRYCYFCLRDAVDQCARCGALICDEHTAVYHYPTSTIVDRYCCACFDLSRETASK